MEPDSSGRGPLLGLNCVEMTGDTAVASWSELVDADIMCVCLAHSLTLRSLIWPSVHGAMRRACARLCGALTRSQPPPRSLTTPGARRAPLRALPARD